MAVRKIEKSKQKWLGMERPRLERACLEAVVEVCTMPSPLSQLNKSSRPSSPSDKFKWLLRGVLFIVRAGGDIIKTEFMHTKRTNCLTKMKIGIYLEEVK